MSLERTQARRNKGDGKIYGFCFHCEEIMDAEFLYLHMILKHGEIIPEEDRHDRTNGKGRKNHV